MAETAKTKTERIKAGDSQYPTDILGRPVKEAKYVFLSGRQIGRVWAEEPKHGHWSWALYESDLEHVPKGMRGRVLMGGSEPTEERATAALLSTQQMYREQKLVGTRPPDPLPHPQGDPRGR